jgi:hypothetical protein
MTSLTSPNFIMMNINSLDESGNDNENTMVQTTNISFNVNVVNLNIGNLHDINIILHENHDNQLIQQSTTTQTRSRRRLPPSIVVVSSDDEASHSQTQIHLDAQPAVQPDTQPENLPNITSIKENNRTIGNSNKKTKLISKTATKSSLKKNKNTENTENIDNTENTEKVDEYRKCAAPLPVKKKLTIYTYEQLKTEKYKMDELRKLCMQYKVSRAGNKDDITKRLYEYCKNSIMPLKIQKVARGFLHRKLISLRGPAFKKRNICTNETDFFTMDEMYEIPYEQFYSYRDMDGFIYGFSILSLHNLITKEGENTKNPYNRNSIPICVKQDIRRIVKLSALLKSPIDIVIKQEVVDPRKRMELKILELFQTMNSYGNYANSEWFMELNHIGHIRFARELYDIWNYRAQLSNIKKYEICPPHGNPFLGTPYYTNSATNTTLVNLGYDVLIRFNVQIIENLVKSAIDIDNKTLGSFYVLTALTLVSEPARNAMPWLYEAGVYNGHEGM